MEMRDASHPGSCSISASAALPGSEVELPRAWLAEWRAAAVGSSRALLQRPAAAIVVSTLLFTAGLLVGPFHRMLQGCPTVAFGDWPVRQVASLTAGRSGIEAWLRLLAIHSSKLAFVSACVVVIAVARRWPKARDSATFVVGAGWALAAIGWQFVTSAVAVAAVVHYGLRRLHSHLAMAITAAMLLALFKYFVSFPSMDTNDVLRNASQGAMSAAAGLGACRLVLYAFEVRSVPRKARSFMTVLAYSPIGLFLWPGDPALISYLTYSTKLPQEQLDRTGARQLYRSGFKFLGLALVLRVLFAAMPRGAAFLEVPFDLQVIVVLAVLAASYLRLSLTADFVCGMSCLAGYDAPDTFASPLLAENPIVFWQSWNIHVLSFLRRAFIFPVVKKSRSLLLTIVAGMAGTVLFHTVLIGLAMGPTMTLFAIFLGQAKTFAATGMIIILGIPFYGHAKAKTHPLPIRLSMAAGTQLSMALLFFPLIHLIYPFAHWPHDRSALFWWDLIQHPLR
jgi:D-alanyl-lipoteichoic acid acyltransferase DltB (MBOAT superfamily)